MDTKMGGALVLLTKQVAKSMVGFYVLSDRRLILKIASKPFNLVINHPSIHTYKHKLR